MTGTLHPEGNAIRVEGEPPYGISDARKLLPILFRLPVEEFAMHYRLIVQSAREGLQLAAAENEFSAERFLYLQKNFAAFNSPDFPHWPAPMPLDVLEDLYVGVPPIDSILCLLDGTRYILKAAGDYTRLETFAEFRELCGLTVYEYLGGFISMEKARLKRVEHLILMDVPLGEVTLSAAKDMAVHTIVARPYLPDQVDNYLARHGFVPMTSDLTPEEGSQ